MLVTFRSECDAGEESHIDPGELLRRPRGLLPLGNPRMVKWIRKCQRATEVGGEWVKFHLRGGFTPLNPHRVSASGLVRVDQRPLAAVPPARLAPRLLSPHLIVVFLLSCGRGSFCPPPSLSLSAYKAFKH